MDILLLSVIRYVTIIKIIYEIRHNHILGERLSDNQMIRQVPEGFSKTFSLHAFSCVVKENTHTHIQLCTVLCMLVHCLGQLGPESLNALVLCVCVLKPTDFRHESEFPGVLQSHVSLAEPGFCTDPVTSFETTPGNEENENNLREWTWNAAWH